MIKIRESDARLFRPLYELLDKGHDFILGGSLALYLQGFLDPTRRCVDLDLIFKDENEVASLINQYGNKGNAYQGVICFRTELYDVNIDLMINKNEFDYNIVSLALGDIKCANINNIIDNKLKLLNNNKKHLADLKYYEQISGIKLNYQSQKEVLDVPSKDREFYDREFYHTDSKRIRHGYSGSLNTNDGAITASFLKMPITPSDAYIDGIDPYSTQKLYDASALSSGTDIRSQIHLVDYDSINEIVQKHKLTEYQLEKDIINSPIEVEKYEPSSEYAKKAYESFKNKVLGMKGSE
jgi:hypothetical protein